MVMRRCQCTVKQKNKNTHEQQRHPCDATHIIYIYIIIWWAANETALIACYSFLCVGTAAVYLNIYIKIYICNIMCSHRATL